MSHSSYEIRKLGLTSAYRANALRSGTELRSDLHVTTGETFFKEKSAFNARSVNDLSKFLQKEVFNFV